MLITLERAYLPHCTIGQLHVPGFHTFATIERPWLGNKPFESCIPEGVYDCKPFNGNRFKDVWELQDVPERSYILIHQGNWARNVQGCIAVGKVLSSQEYMVINSENAINELRAFLPDEFQIRITVKQPEYP
ncbi:DUF5675 family protein [Endozoicomonas gorgoniicola]|uniref:DUF5675 family protein n=1 Tax=Endozoicomonas gorgoniicola TaxID=1234144 RepID=A0ABT3N4C9_9GAMM|nr:DUF5675 family protein [Endozoicomonas gorgoniicola]MCW7556500.1 DUF5675 family protein [Endozoicomonas gorgoniicola]